MLELLLARLGVVSGNESESEDSFVNLDLNYDSDIPILKKSSKKRVETQPVAGSSAPKQPRVDAQPTVVTQAMDRGWNPTGAHFGYTKVNSISLLYFCGCSSTIHKNNIGGHNIDHFYVYQSPQHNDTWVNYSAVLRGLPNAPRGPQRKAITRVTCKKCKEWCEANPALVNYTQDMWKEILEKVGYKQITN